MASIALKGYSQIMQPKWETCLGGSDWDEGTGIMRMDSIYYIVAETQSDDGDISYNHGYHDVWFVEIDDSGGFFSEKTFGGSLGDGGFIDIMSYNDSIFYITATTRSSDGDISDNPWPEYANIWILQINKQGEILWESVHGGSLID